MSKTDFIVESMREAETFNDAFSHLQKLPNRLRTKEVYKVVIEKSKTFEDAKLICEDMKENNIPINDKTFRSLLLKTKNDHQVLELLSVVNYFKGNFNKTTHRELLKKLKKQSNIEKVFSLLEGNAHTISRQMYEKVIYKTKDFKDIIPYLNKMREHGLKLDESICNIVLNKINNFSDGMLFAYDMVEEKIKIREKAYLKLISLTLNNEQLNELINLLKSQNKLILNNSTISNAYLEKRNEFEQLKNHKNVDDFLESNEPFEFKKVGVDELKRRYSSLYDEEEKPSAQLYFLKSDEKLHDHINFLATEINVKTINVATGFLYKSGIERILQTFQSVSKNQGIVNVLAGNLQKYPSALTKESKSQMMDLNTAEYLNTCMLKYPLHLKTIEDRFFHGKFYIFEGISKAFVIMGSSNISSSGFCGNHEVNLLYILDVNSKIFRTFKKEFKAIWDVGTSIEILNLEKFSKIENEYDQLSNKPKPYKKMKDVEFTDTLNELSDEEIRKRWILWKNRQPKNIYRDFEVDSLKDYILFEYPEYNLLVFESFKAANAYYCFEGENIESLLSEIKYLSKNQIAQLNSIKKRGYHIRNHNNLELSISSLFVKK